MCVKNFVVLFRETMDHMELTPERAQTLLRRILNKLSGGSRNAGESNEEKENMKR